jgi:putative glutamine amidotransferase
VKPLIGITAPLEEGRVRLRREYPSAIEQAGGIPVVLPLQGDPSSLLDRLDGLLLPGGGDLDPSRYGEVIAVSPAAIRAEPPERTDFEMALMRLAIERDLPLFAICYGMQLLNVVHGGALYQDIIEQQASDRDHRLGMHHINAMVGGVNGSYTVNSSHHQAVRTVGQGLDVVAIAEDGIIEGIVLREALFCMGVQWHPERIFHEPLSALLFQRFISAASRTGGRRS